MNSTETNEKPSRQDKNAASLFRLYQIFGLQQIVSIALWPTIRSDIGGQWGARQARQGRQGRICPNFVSFSIFTQFSAGLCPSPPAGLVSNHFYFNNATNTLLQYCYDGPNEMKPAQIVDIDTHDTRPDEVFLSVTMCHQDQ